MGKNKKSAAKYYCVIKSAPPIKQVVGRSSQDGAQNPELIVFHQDGASALKGHFRKAQDWPRRLCPDTTLSG
jgi:hypothetical protein